MRDGEGGAKIRHEISLTERLGRQKMHEELMSTLGDDSYAVFQIKIWLQKFRNGDLSYKDSPSSGPPL
jgi:hypothetical protein